MSRSPLITLEKCIDLGVDYVLTSGGANSVVEGEDAIKLLVTKAEGTCVTIIAGAVLSLLGWRMDETACARMCEERGSGRNRQILL